MGQGRNEGERGTNSLVTESPWGREIIARGAEKAQQCHKYFLRYSTLGSELPQVRIWGRQTPNLLIVPGTARNRALRNYA